MTTLLIGKRGEGGGIVIILFKQKPVLLLHNVIALSLLGEMLKAYK